MTSLDITLLYLLAAVLARDLPQIRIVLTAYAQRSCDLVVSALTVA